MLKGVSASLRSVYITAVLLVALIYTSTIFVKTQSEEHMLLRAVFPSLHIAM